MVNCIIQPELRNVEILGMWKTVGGATLGLGESLGHRGKCLKSIFHRRYGYLGCTVGSQFWFPSFLRQSFVLRWTIRIYAQIFATISVQLQATIKMHVAS